MEKWKFIEGSSKYQISNKGRVRNVQTGKYLKGRKTKSGYEQVSLRLDDESGFKNRYIHRLVAIAFIEKIFNKNEVNHKNGIKHDNRVENLEWVNASENQKHRHTIGNSKTSQRRIGKFSKEGELIKEFNSIVEAAKEIGSPRTSIDSVLQGRRYSLKGYVYKYLD